MKITRGTDIVRETWRSLPEIVRWWLLAVGKTPSTLTTGDVRAIREALS